VNAIGAGGKAIEVLVLEDSPGHVRLTQEAFRHANRLIHLHVAFDGVEAMAFALTTLSTRSQTLARRRFHSPMATGMLRLNGGADENFRAFLLGPVGDVRVFGGVRRRDAGGFGRWWGTSQPVRRRLFSRPGCGFVLGDLRQNCANRLLRWRRVSDELRGRGRDDAIVRNARRRLSSLPRVGVAGVRLGHGRISGLRLRGASVGRLPDRQRLNRGNRSPRQRTDG
jgi:hypothetical protein